MKKTLIVSICLLMSLASCTQKQKTTNNPNYIKLGWKELKGLDYKSGDMDQIIKESDGKKVKIAGFITPLTDDAQQIFEFTLVPYPVSCIHTPPPPPNQIVVVTLQNSHISPEDLWSPFWVYGTLQVDKTQNQYFTASYTMEAEFIEKYQ